MPLLTELEQVRLNVGDPSDPLAVPPVVPIFSDDVINTMLARYPDDTSRVRVLLASADLIDVRGTSAGVAGNVTRKRVEGEFEVEYSDRASTWARLALSFRDQALAIPAFDIAEINQNEFSEAEIRWNATLRGLV